MKDQYRTIPFKFSAKQIYILAILLVLAIASNSISAFLWLSYFIETFGGK